ncbi:MAG: hypothetical protein E7333_03750 [Clostridiales bacterium]|nr:hypothetical protein [Clostridiales bacterium]
MKSTFLKILMMLMALLLCLSACTAPTDSQKFPVVMDAVTDVPASAPTDAPTDVPAAAPAHQLVAEKPEAPYLEVAFYIGGQYVSGYIPLTQEEVMNAMMFSAVVDTMMTIALVTPDNPDENYGPLPQPLVDIAAETAGFLCQSPADVGNIVSATMDTTLFGETHSQTVTDPADLARLQTVLQGAQKMGFRSKCPWTGVLTLTMDDGRTMVIQKASDSCQSMLFGTSFCYEISKADNTWLWELFHEAAPESFSFGE